MRQINFSNSDYKAKSAYKNIYCRLAIMVCSIVAIFSFCGGVACLKANTFYVSAEATETETPETETPDTGSQSALPDGATEWTDVYNVSLSSDSSYYIINGLQSSFSSLTTIDIPSVINDIPVKEISASAFRSKTSITSLTIPDSVTTIGGSAFYGCTGLTSLTIPDSVTTIGNSAFSGCSALTEINFNAIACNDLVSNNNAFYHAGQSGTGITVTIGKEVTRIPACLFRPASNYSDFPKITSVVFEEGSVCESIGVSAFYGCASLTSLTIPDSVTTIGNSAFSGCTSLTGVYITDLSAWCKISFGAYSNLLDYALYLNNELVTDLIIPEDITEIKAYAFEGCTSLTTLTIPDSVTKIGVSAFYGCTGLTSLTIPDSVTTIGNSAFYGCTSLTTLTIPDSVTKIDNQAFAICSGLTSLTIPDSVTTIGDYAFSSCHGLTSLTIPDSVTTIGNCAFRYCDSLTSLTIGNSVTTIGDSAFEYCTALTEINFNATACDDLNENNKVFYQAGQSGTGITVTIGKEVPRIPAYLFRPASNSSFSPKITSVVFEDDSECESIGEYAFYNCTSLASLTIGNSVTTIGDSAFYGCTSLTSLTIGNSVTTIGNSAFYGCTSLTSLTIGNGVTTIGYSVFYGCTSLTTLTIPDSVTTIGVSAFYGCTGLTSLTIPDSVTTIGNSAFYGCTSLTTLTIPDSVTKIDNQAFAICSGLTSLTIPDSVTTIGYSAFRSCTSLTTLTIPDSVTTIDGEAFYFCTGLTSLTIPDSVTTIDDEAFAYCSSLTSLTIGSGVKTIDYLAFEYCAALTEINFNAIACNDLVSNNKAFCLAGQSGTGITVTIGKEVTRIPAYLFCSASKSSDSPKITSVVFEEGSVCESIGNSAFSGCTSLTTLTIPDSVTTIGNSAFSGCTSLTTLTIPDSVTTIGNYAFDGCTSLTSLTIGNSVKTIGGSAFEYCTALTEINFNAIECNDLYYSTFYRAGESGMGITVTIGEEVTKVPAYLFCPNLDDFGFSPKITSVVFDEGSECGSIGKYAFYNCTSLTSLTIGNSVTTIGDFAFYGCTALTEINFNATACDDLFEDNEVFSQAGQSGTGITVTIGKKVTKVPANLFYPNTYDFYFFPNITSVVFEDDSECESIGEYAFYNCTSLTSLTIGNSVTTIGYFAFSCCNGLTSLTIGNSVTTIGDEAFSCCYGLTSLTIGNSVTTIGDYAFADCYGLTTLTIPDSVTTIGEGAFFCCEELSSVVLGESVTTIGDYAFEDCISLAEITLPKSVTYIGKAFYGITGIELYIEGSVAAGERDEPLRLISKDALSEAIVYVSNADLSAYRSAPYYTNTAVVAELRAKSYTLTMVFNIYDEDNKIAIISDSVDPNSPELLEAVEDILESPKDFLEEVGFTRTGYEPECFYTSANMLDGEKVTSAGDFYKDTTIYLRWKYTGPDWDSLYEITKSDSNVTITGLNEKNAIGVVVFEMSDEVTEIGAQAFCSNEFEFARIQSVKIGKNVKAIGDLAFANCINLSTLSFEGNDVLETMGNLAFGNCAIKGELALPSSILESGVGGSWFANDGGFGSNAITKFAVIGDTGNIQATEEGLILNADSTKVLQAPNILPSNIVLSDRVVSICKYAFSYTSGLESISGKNVAELGDNAFYRSSLGYFDFPNLGTLGDLAFADCLNLVTIKLGSKVSEIGTRAFAGCDNLRTIVVEGSIGSSDRTAIPTINYNDTYFIVDSPNYVSAYVNGNDLNLYQKDSAWSRFILVGVENETVCTVTIDLDGGVGYSSAYFIMYGNTIDLSILPIKEGYTFVHWQRLVGEDWVGFDYETSLIKEDTSIRAVWMIIDYKIIYHLNGGNIDENVGETYTQTFTILDFGSDKNNVIEIAETTQEGYTFVGWYTNAEFDSARVTEILYNSLTIAQINAREDIHLYAKWNIITYTMAFEESDKYTIALDNTTLNPVPWNEDFGFVIVLSEAYTQNTSENIIVKLVSASGDETVLDVSEYGVNDMKLHYLIPNVKQTYSIKVEGLKKNIYNVYFVTSIEEEQVSGLTSVLTVTHGESIDSDTLGTPTASGYTFVGYFKRLSEESGETYDITPFDFTSPITESIALLAKFEAIEYKVTLILNGGKLNGLEKENFELSYTTETGLLLPSANSEVYRIERLGYTFGGWYEVDESESPVIIEQYAIGTIGDRTVSLQWNINTYHISYTFNGGSTESSYDTTFTINDSVTLVVPTRRGHTFEGWYTDSQMVYNRIEKIESTASDVTVYAKWSSIKYNMVYHLNGSQYTNVKINGVIVPSESNIYTHVYVYDEHSVYTLLVPTRDGYTFAGWFESSELDGNGTISIDGSEIVEDKDFYAKWSACEYIVTLDYGDIYEKSDDESEKLEVSTLDIENAGNRLEVGHVLQLDGYTFLGWFDDDNTKVEFLTLDNIDNIDNMTLTAKFRINKMSVTLIGDNVAGNVTILAGDQSVTTVDYGSDLVFKVSIVNPMYSKSIYAVAYSFDSEEYTSLEPSNGTYTINNLTNDVWIRIDNIEINTYNVEFISNGGTGVEVMRNILHGSVIEEPDSPTRDGYTFVGWCSDINLNNQFDFNTPIISDLHLYAKWESIKHTATLRNNINDETKSIEFDVSNQGSISLIDNNFVIKGYGFVGFYLLPVNAENYAFDDSDRIENLNNIHRDCEIIARFEIIVYNIYYGIDAGENNANNPSTYTVNTEDIVLKPASKTNYKFLRWERADNNSAITRISKGSTGDQFVVAIFEPISDDYAVIKYYAQGSFYSEVAVKKDESISETESAQIVPKEIAGYTFVDWYTDDSYTTVFDMSTKINSAISLYGKYTKTPYTITYISNEGEFVNPTDNITSIDIESQFILQNASKLGYQFDGWFKNVDITNGVYDFESAERVVSIVGQVGDITLVAKFTIITYTISYYLDGGELNDRITNYTILDENILLGEPIKVGYEFSYWADENNNPITSISPSICRNITLTANYSRIQYVITYIDDKTVTDNVTEYNVDTLGFAPKHNNVEGWEFLGWFEGNDKIDTLAGGKVGNITITAKYKIIEYRIIYILDGGVVESENPTTYTIESGVSRFNSPSKLGGWSFRHWMNADTKQAVSNIPVGTTGDIVLQAVYQQLDDYIFVTYYVNGKRYQMDSVEKGQTVNDIQVEKDYYDFVGWYADAELTTPYDTTTAVIKDMQLYAKFTPTIYTITYRFVDEHGNYMGGVSNNNADKFSVESLVEFEAPIMSGYTFSGFALDGEQITTTFGIYQDVVVVGTFNIQYYSIAYVLDGGNANNPTLYTIKDESIVLNPATKDGYTFLGWYDSITDEKISIIDTSTLKNYVLIAKWQSNNKPPITNNSSNDDVNVLLTAIFVVLAICAFIGAVGVVNVVRKRKIEKKNNSQLNKMWSRVETTTKIRATRPSEEKENIASYKNNIVKEKDEPFVMPSTPASVDNSTNVEKTSTDVSGTPLAEQENVETKEGNEQSTNTGKITPYTIERNRTISSNEDTSNNENE